MSTMLERMRARLKERTPTFEKDLSIYPFWNMKFGATSTLRLLPYNDPYSGLFWAEKVMLPMQFTDPDDPAKVFKFLAPCREMYDHSSKCPVLAPVRALYSEEKELRNSGATKDADKMKKIAGFHWKKPTFYYQGFVVKGMTEEEVPENLIRVFPFNKMVHNKIKNSIFEADEDAFETLPTGEFTEEDVQALLGDGDVDMDIFNGYNFIVKKGQRGDYADWTSESTWARALTPLTDEQLAAVAEHGFWDLTKRLPDRPSDEQYDVLTEMMNVSIERMQTGENGVWRREWEEAGFKPFKPRDNEGGNNAAKDDDDTKTTSSAAKSSTSSGSGGSAKAALDKLKAARGKGSADAEAGDAGAGADDDVPFDTEESGADESPAEVVAAADDAGDSPAAEDDSGKADVSDLAAKIKARVGKKSA